MAELSANQTILDAFQAHAREHLDTDVPAMDLCRLADMAVAALRGAGHPVIAGEPETQWCVWYGGDDPNECAGGLIDDDRAAAEEMVQWIVDGRLARRSVHYGPWVEIQVTNGG